jgi:Domain of unknown function (DUF4350)
MPLGIAASDRKLLIVCGAVLVLLIVATVLLTPPDDSSESRVPSTYSAHSAGAEAAYMLLTRLHYPVSRWEQEPGELPSEPSNTLLILANPTDVPSVGERAALDRFVKNGGRVLFTGPLLSVFFPAADISTVPPDPKWTTYSPYVPSQISRRAPKVTLQPDATWGGLNESQLALYGEPNAAVVVAWHYGAGKIFWWAGPTPLTNAGISSDDNLNFFLNSVANWNDNEDYQIYWDEYFHGKRNSLWSYASHTSITWGLMQSGLIAAAVIFTFSRRSGPTYKPARVSRLSPLEYVDTLGGLYQRAKAGPVAVAVSLQRLRYLLTRQLGLPNDTPDPDLARAAEGRLAWKGFQSGKLLPRASAAVRADSVTSREALDLVQELEGFAARLEIRSSATKEKS